MEALFTDVLQTLQKQSIIHSKNDMYVCIYKNFVMFVILYKKVYFYLLKGAFYHYKHYKHAIFDR